ncbi:EAL domain-containing protein [Pseudomonas sp. OST1909]|uniref:EAL domain-containing protein n=1 Tax=Pseudomonas sp. OST1909 TaxID=2777367 RepID=UPI001887C960|nr:EAL domain-containing protein [Pseudomonas sp. OST1909]QOY72981.1 EAL domain-containing protein [Pseudomonas sp. OST1909]
MKTMSESLAIPLLESLKNDVASRRSLASNIASVRVGFAKGQFQTLFQPKFDLLSGKVDGVEALVLWNHPQHGVIQPSFFISIFERCGLLDDLLFSQLAQGLDFQRKALAAGVVLNVAFNVQSSQFSNLNFLSKVSAVLDLHKAPGAGVTFELTETGFSDLSAAGVETLTGLRLMGCGLSIDDFGAGFSSLRRLAKFPFNEIKLDSEFVCGAVSCARYRTIISSTLALGDALGMPVIVEGIETEEQRQLLMGLGCTRGQGYFFARPMSGGALLRWLLSSDMSA